MSNASWLARSMIRAFAALAVLAPLAPAEAQPYPNRPIRIVVPFPPGGATDIVGRVIAQKLGDSFGQAVFVDNRGGAGGAIGSEAVAKSPGDGYTLLVGSTTTISINPWLNPKLPYNPQRDFVPISLVGFVPHILLVPSSVPASSLREFIAYAKAQPKPLAFASGGVGTPHHLAGEIFKKMTGIDMVHVPYKGSGPAMNGILGGEVQFASFDLPAALPQLGGGRLKALALAAESRDALAPEVPTAAEAGLPGFEITGWYGIFAPASTPRDIVAKLSGEIAKQLSGADTRASLSKTGVNVLGGTAEQFAAHLKREDAKWAKAVQESGAKPE
jgi:tripartite-type tricarboxylate transporter receptor subunit TctC